MPKLELFWILVVLFFLAIGGIQGFAISDDAGALGLVLLAIWFGTSNGGG